MDNGELYIRVLFDTPTDYDETLGLAIPGNSPYSKNEFSGIYKLITVTNEFYRGTFQQVLDLVWITIEEGQSTKIFNATQRIEALSLQSYNARGGIASRFSGPTILQNNLIAGGSASVGAAITAGSSSGGGLLGGVVDQVKQAASGAVNKAIKDATDPLVDKAKEYAKEQFGKIKDALGFGDKPGASTLGGSGGADGAASSGSGNVPEQHVPEQSAMNTASNEFNSDSTNATIDNTDVSTPIEDTGGYDTAGFDGVEGDGIDGAVGGFDGGGDFFG